MKRIAVIGAGISGLGAAYALKDVADVTLFERENRLGGHAYTHHFDYDGKKIAVDLGFIVYNALNYPNLIAFFDALGVETSASDMSFAVSDPNGWEWTSTLSGIFAQKRNLLSPKFHRFWRTILRFNDLARAELASNTITDPTLGAWLARHKFEQSFLDNYILPMGAAIWSTPERDLLDYPARSFFDFFENHRLMHKERPKWRTVAGGSSNYVTKAAAALKPRVHLASAAERIFSFNDRLAVVSASGEQHVFDDIIFATHSDETLRLLAPHFEEPSFLLRSVRYRPNQIYLHRDTALMPKHKSAWASWNVLKQTGDDVCVTYWMNRLQNLGDERPVFITLNPATPPATEKTFHTYAFDHPQFDAAAEAAVRGLKRLQGQNGLWFAGAWMGRGFHEDGLKSGLAAALSLGGKVAWNAEGVEIYTPIEKTSDVASMREAQL